jgi:hypothetical protein
MYFYFKIQNVDSIFSNGISLFEESEKNLSRLDTFLIQEKIEDIVEAFDDNIELCIKYISNLNDFYGFTSEFESVLIESIFSLMLRLPRSKSKLIFYSSLIVNLCKKWPKDKKPLNEIVNEGVLNLFEMMDSLDIECVERAANFFSFYLSNIQVDFDFERFAEISSLPRNNFKCVFFTQLIEKLCNLFDKSKIITIVSVDDLLSFFPKEAQPLWKFSDPNETYHYDSQVICDNILNKKEYNTWSNKFEAAGNDFVYVFMSCVFYCKSKTFSHLRESITLFKDAIAMNLNSKDQQIIALEALSEVWGHHNVYFSFIFDLIMRFGFVDCLVAVKWIFDKLASNPQSIAVSYQMFDLINVIVNNCSNSIVRIQKELSKEQENMAKCEDGFQTNIVKNIETYEESLEKYFEIERKVYHEIMFVILSLK